MSVAATRMAGRATPRRLELAARVQALRGWNSHAEIAAELEISRSYVNALINDPDGSKQRARRDTYKGVCERCGGETKSAGTSRPSRICASCSRELQHENKKWTREAIIDAIQRWATAHGGVPPRSNDWIRADPVNGYPASTSVYRTSTNPGCPFAKWSDAVEAAGFGRPWHGWRSRNGAPNQQERKPPMEFIIFQQNGPGLVEIGRVDAPRATYALEQVATEEGEYFVCQASKLVQLEVCAVKRLTASPKKAAAAA